MQTKSIPFGTDDREGAGALQATVPGLVAIR
jgi:hypothetical protein